MIFSPRCLGPGLIVWTTWLIAGTAELASPRQIILYNGVYRSGSTAMLQLVEKLSKQNGFVLLAATSEFWDTALHEPLMGNGDDQVSTGSNLTCSETAGCVARRLASVINNLLKDEDGHHLFIHGRMTIDAVRAFQVAFEEATGVEWDWLVLSIVRDPVALVTSGYVYHNNIYVQLLPGAGDGDQGW